MLVSVNSRKHFQLFASTYLSLKAKTDIGSMGFQGLKILQVHLFTILQKMRTLVVLIQCHL